MRKALCFFAIALMLMVYPCTQIMNPELLSFWGNIETDVFNWHRMLLVSCMGIFCIPAIMSVSPEIIIYVGLLLTSFILSAYPQMGWLGSPNHHEGLPVMMGYIGIYLACVKCGLFKSLEKSLDVVVYVLFGSCLLQLWYGNFLDFYLFKLIFPWCELDAMTWPLYGLTGNSNHLGLFISLFLPYTFLRKKYAQSAILLCLLAGSQCRGAMLSVIVVSCLLSRKAFLLSMFAGALILVAHPMRRTDLGVRAYIWRESIPVLKETLLIGKGPSTFPLYFKQLQEISTPVGLQGVVVDRPHNMYINIWQNTGLISLITLASLVTRTLFKATDRSLLMGVIGFLIAGVFTDSVLVVTPYFLIFLGAITHEYNEKRRSNQRKNRSHDRFGTAYGLLSFPDNLNP